MICRSTLIVTVSQSPCALAFTHKLLFCVSQKQAYKAKIEEQERKEAEEAARKRAEQAEKQARYDARIAEAKEKAAAKAAAEAEVCSKGQQMVNSEHTRDRKRRDSKQWAER